MTEDKAQALYAKRNKQSGLDKEVETSTLVGFISSLAPVLLLAIPFLIPFLLFTPFIGLIFSIIGLRRTLQHPDKYTGRGFAIAGIVLSILQFIGLVVAFFIFGDFLF